MVSLLTRPGVDGLVGEIVVGGSVVLDQLDVLHLETLANSVNLLVDLSPVMVSLLTSSGHSILDPAWMPSSNTSNFSQTLVGFSGQFLGVPSAGDALEPVTLGHANDVDHLVGGEHGRHGDLLLKMVPGKVDLVGHGASVELDLHDVSLLLSPTKNLHLGVDNHTDRGAVFLHLSQLLLYLLLAEIIGPLGAGLGEGLLLGLRPVLVKSSLGLFADMFGPNSLEGSHTPGGLDVSNDTDTDDGRRLDDGDGLHDLLLVDL